MTLTFSAIPSFVLLIIALHSAETFFNITDVSQSNICDGGLWSDEDKISLDITVNGTGQNGTGATFLLEAQERGSPDRKQMCLIKLLPSSCGGKSSDVCFCHSVKGGIFRIRFNSVASISYNDNVLWVNKNIKLTTRLPTTYQDDVPVSVAFNGRLVQIQSSSCTFPLRNNPLVNVAFCVSGLNGQVLTISRDDVVDVSQRSDCITKTFPAPTSPQVFKFTFSDRCRHRDFFHCLVDPRQKITISKNIMNTTSEATNTQLKEATPLSDYFVEYSYLLFILVSSTVSMIIIFSLTCCYLKLQRRYRFFSTDSERSARLTFQEKLLYKSSVHRSLSNFLGKVVGLSAMADPSRDDYHDPFAMASTSSPVDGTARATPSSSLNLWFKRSGGSRKDVATTGTIV